MSNYYDVLGIDQKASQIKIKKAYFGLVRKYPPDHYPDKFMEIREAYEALSNEETRREYDDTIILSPILKAEFEYSRKAFREGDLKTAIKGFEAVVKREPDSFLAQDLLGQAYLANGNSVKAIRMFEKLTRKFPDNASFMGHLAESYLDRGWHNRARDAYEKAVKLDEDNIAFWLGWSETYRIADEFEGQRHILYKALDKAKEGHWDSIDIYMHIILNDIFRGDMEDTEEHLAQLTDLVEDRVDIRDVIGVSLAELSDKLFSTGWPEMAIIIADHALQLLPEDNETEDLRKKINLLINTHNIMDEFTSDEDIHEDVKHLVAMKAIPDYLEDAGIPGDVLCLMVQALIASELQIYLPSIHIIKERYPKIYEMEKDFFESLKNPRKRKSLRRRADKAYREYGDLLESFKGDDGFEDSFDNDYDFFEVQQPFVREHPKVGRNDPCPCGSGKKYKRCCGR